MKKVGYTELLHTTDELRKLILENPELPIIVFAGQEACAYNWSYCSCSTVHAYIGEYFDYDEGHFAEKCILDKTDFEDELIQEYEDSPECENMSDDEWNEFIENKMAELDKYWKKCIVLYVDN